MLAGKSKSAHQTNSGSARWKTKYSFVQFDDRGSYRRDENYPHVIFLASVLRWAVKGTHVVCSTTNGVTEHYELDMEATVSNNSRALDSTGAFLADLIESKCVSIYSKHSRLPLGNAELQLVLGKLRGMDGGELGGLIGDDGFGYYLDGRELFVAVLNSALPVEDDFQKGGVWHRLAWDAPPDWHDSLGGKTRHYETAAAKAEPVPIEAAKPTASALETSAKVQLKTTDWRNDARTIADEFDETDAKGGAYDSVSHIAERVATEMRKRKIQGPRGALSCNTILREALQGGRWNRKR